MDEIKFSNAQITRESEQPRRKQVQLGEEELPQPSRVAHHGQPMMVPSFPPPPHFPSDASSLGSPKLWHLAQFDSVSSF